ncbi:MAG: hypothetical protein J6Y33_02350 [Prevotella sp.]|nr:hypothetical protein [Prevotella sp.]
MKRYLLFMIACVCAVSGAWAEASKIGSTSRQIKSRKAAEPTVVYSSTDMHLHDGPTNGDNDNYVFWYQGDQVSEGVATLTTSGSIGTLIQDKTFVKVKIDGYLEKSGLADLANINCQILDLSELDLNHADACSMSDLSEQFCMSDWDLNHNVKFVILPEGATREQIVSADKVSGLKNIYSIVSFTHDTNDNNKFDFTAYNRVRGTLAPALVAGGKGMQNVNWKYGNYNTYTPDMYNNIGKSATISGLINAYDLAKSSTTLDEYGHLLFDKTYADESKGADDRVNIGTRVVCGGISGYNSGPKKLDLQYAEIEGPQYINDIKISSLVNVGYLTHVIIPENESVKETPSYFITHNNVKEICIPSNIETIRTHFAPSVDHIWTTGYKVGQTGGDAYELTYDNGCYASKDGTASYGYTGLPFSASSLYPYGTYTFSSNLKMIETGAFSNTNPCVKDVYVLAKVAPECHVDAFNTKMYVGNGGYDPHIVDGVITRDSYVNGNQWITMLHYPRECTSPEVQRYTDPTRSYTIASNEVDGKGGVLYYPSQSEFIAAYGQGTTGYLWNAWERTYEWGMLQSDGGITSEWNESAQNRANDYFKANPDLTKSPGDTKYTCTSFYDVTANGQFEQPDNLVPYYDVRWNERVLSDKGDGVQLYPAPEVDTQAASFYKYLPATEDDFNNNIKVYTLNGSTGEYEVYVGAYNNGTSYYKRVQSQVIENGSPKFETCANGTYVQDTRYVEDEDGTYVLHRTQDGSTTTDTPVDGVSGYYSDEQLTNEVTPKVANNTYWYENGTQPVFSEDAVYAPVTGVSTYYTLSNGVYTETIPQLNSSYYYKTGNEVDAYSAAVYKPVADVWTYYYDNNGTKVQENPQFNNWATYYYKDGTEEKDIYVTIYNYNTVVVLGQTYYTSDDGSKVEAVNPALNGTYYYKTGQQVTGWVQELYYGDTTKKYYTYNGNDYVLESNPQWNTQYWVYYDGLIDEYLSTTTYSKDVTQYYSFNGTSYTPVNAYFSNTLYYISGSEIVDKYVATTELVNNVSTYYTMNGNQYSEMSGDIFSKAYYYVVGKTDEYVATTTYTPSQTYYIQQNGTYVETNVLFGQQGYYYVTGTSKKYDSANGEDWNAHTYYTDDAGAAVATTITFDQSYYIPNYTYVYETFVSGNDDGDPRYELEYYYRAYDSSKDGEAQRYCPVMEDLEFKPVTKQNDYRGWHQFVLSAYSKGTDIPMQPMRSYQTDNDWWTICLPYDLTYNEVMLFYGDVNETGQPNASKVPIVCLLSNVVRDKENNHIRLNFSSNLMEHKATKVDGEWIVSADKAPNHDKSTDADVIIHKGVPYAIKPMFKAGAGRQFDVYGRDSVNAQISQGRITANSVDYPGLYEKLKAAEDIAGEDFRNMQEDNLYTVPALIPVSQATDDEVVDKTEITYEGEKYYRLNSIDYTFVGALQLNVIPPFSYFLGYKNSSLFVYADYDTQEFEENKKSTTPDYRNTFKWTNNACVICPNLLSADCKDTQKGANNKYNLKLGHHDGMVEVADNTGASVSGARWEIFNKQDNIGLMSMLTDDRFTQSSSSSRGIFAQGCEIHYGFDMTFPMVDGIKNLDSDEAKDTANGDQKVYSLDGQYMGTSRQGLKKGVYIIGGRKYVVK